MAHDASVLKLGSTQSSKKVVSSYASDPADTPAGFAVCLASDGSLSKDNSDGDYAGVSLGMDLSDTEKTSVCRTGLRVPLRCMDQYAHGLITITSYANLIDDTDDTIKIGATTFTAQAGAATPGQTTFQAATSNDATATSLADQINAHATASTVVEATANAATVYIRALAAGDAGETIDFVYDDVDGTGDSVGATMSPSGGDLEGGGDDFTIAKGALVYINSVTGEACASDHENAVVSNAVYAEAGSFTGIDESDVSVTCALIDMPGGL